MYMYAYRTLSEKALLHVKHTVHAGLHRAQSSIIYFLSSCIYMYISLRFGPLINHWTTHFEAKHKYFKHLANVLGNFTNICYSLALRHQLHQCYLMLNSHTLSGEKIEIGPGNKKYLHVQCMCIYTLSMYTCVIILL